MYIQYLEGGDLVFEHFLGFVEVRQHVLRLSAVDGAHFGELPLVPLRQLLFVSPEEREEQVTSNMTVLKQTYRRVKLATNDLTYKKWMAILICGRGIRAIMHSEVF